MKLSKSIIVTGLLFSSILGGMNVNNVVSYAASNEGANVNETPTKKTVEVEFVGSKDGKIISAPNLAKQDLEVKGENVVDRNSIKIPYNYVLKDVSSVSNNKITVTLDEEMKQFDLKVVDENYQVIDDKKKIDVNMNNLSKSEIAKKLPDYGKSYRLENADNAINIDVENNTVTVQLTTVFVRVSYMYNNEIIGTESIKMPSTHEFGKDDLTKYKEFIVEDKVTAGNNNTVAVNLQNKEVTLSFKGTNSTTIDQDFSSIGKDFELTPKMENLNDLQIKLPENYRLKNAEEPIKIVDGKVQVDVEKTKVIKVNFEVQGNKKTTFPAKNMVIAADATSVKANEVNIPTGYELVNDKDIPFNKDGKSITVSIKKANTNNGSSNHTVNNNQNHSSNQTTPTNKVITKDFKGTVATNPGQYVTLYNAEGKAIAGRRLAGDSNWAADKTMVRDGVKYYRVATNEWVKASDVYEYTVSNAVVETAAGNYKKLFDSKGNIVSNRGLAAGTKWMTDKVALIQGEKMYRVATNEWLKAVDVK
ncbi:SLAP domain-containing protein [Companilactobacillus sp. HBUAS56257]|uniref:SLAP domain-containing protein n=1 Tax=Companilactobacillus sp. HBUAS56257 TaxID=3109360 RepID=UPI002FF31DBF